MSAVVSVTSRGSRLAPLATEVYFSLVSHESLTERGIQAGSPAAQMPALPGIRWYAHASGSLRGRRWRSGWSSQEDPGKAL